MFDFNNLIIDILKIAGPIIILIVLLGISLLIVRKVFRNGNNLPPAYRNVLLSVSVPKEAGLEDNTKTLTKEQIWEKIAQAEEMFAALGGLGAKGSFNTYFFGRQDHVSFEIVALDGKINFYIATPQYLQRYLEQQVHAQYPYAQIEVIPDYNIFSPQGKVAAASLQLSRTSMFAIKTFRKMDSDPLEAVTNSLSKLKVNDGAAIQIVARSAHKSWRRPGLKVVQAMQSGESLGQALKSSGGASAWARVFNTASKGIKSFAVAGTTGKTEEQKKAEEQSKGYSPPHKMSALEEETAKSIEEKAAKAGLDANIRIVVSASNQGQAESYLKDIFHSFSQYSIYEYGNKFSHKRPRKIDKLVSDFVHRNFNEKKKIVLNTEELASIYHFPLPTAETPNINWLGARSAPAPIDAPTEGVIIGKNTYRGQETLIRLKGEDRMRHVYIIGMTGVGKSVTMENMAKQDINSGRGVCFLDPHGTAIDRIAPNIPTARLKDVIYFNPADTEKPLGLNMLEARNQQEMDFAAQESINIFLKLLPDPAMAGPMFEHYMRNALLLLMANPDDPGTLVELPRVFTDEDFRKEKLQHVKDILVRDFWEKEYPASQRGSTGADMLGYIISKVGRFIENEMMRNIIGQAKSGFNFRQIMDEGKILLVNLSKGQVGDTNSSLLGLIIVSKLQMAAMARAVVSEEQRKDFFLYIDEFQNFITDSISTILSEARKYRLSLNMAHQFIGQLIQGENTAIKDAVFGNVGTIICYRIGADDAEFLAKQFAPVFNEHDLMNIPKFNAYVRLMIDNQAARPFNVAMFSPEKGNPAIYERLKAESRAKYGRPKAEVEADIIRRAKLGELG